MKHFVYIFILLTLLGFTACSDDTENEANKNTNSNTKIQKQIGEISDDADDLTEFVKLPFIPEDVSWQQLEVSGGKKIVAVIRFTAEDTMTILGQSQAAEKVEIAAERWFPQELTAQSDVSGDQVLHGTTYATNIFFKEPFNKGRIVKLDNSDYFVIEVTNF
jgi:hypothetical protein